MDRPKLTALGAIVLLWALWLVPMPASASGHGSLPQDSNVAVQELPMPNGGKSNVELSSVSCVDVHFCIAVGEFRPAERYGSYQGEHPVILGFNGKAWSLMHPPTLPEADLGGVDCLSMRYCVAVGELINTQETASPLIEEMHGNAWSVVPSPIPDVYPTNSSQLQAVSCTAVEICTAVGTDYGVDFPRGVSANTGIIETETPSGWNLVQLAPLVPTPEPSAAGATVVPATAFDPSRLVAVSCTPSLCVAAGDQRGFIERNGGSWAAINNPPMSMNGIDCMMTRSCLGVGSGGSAQVNSTNISLTTAIDLLTDAGWKRVGSPNSSSSENTLSSVACGLSRLMRCSWCVHRTAVG